MVFFYSLQGVIQTLEMLDREERSIYTLLVQAVDSASTPNTAYATVSAYIQSNMSGAGSCLVVCSSVVRALVAKTSGTGFDSKQLSTSLTLTYH